jgi:hypothetical protein
VFEAPNGEDCAAGAFEPNPPNAPVDPAVAVPPPNKLLPVVVLVLPNAGLAPNPLFCVVPKPTRHVSDFLQNLLQSRKEGPDKDFG